MSNYFLRMEGVNLANFVDDTQNLSTVRGGGLLLLNSVEDVEAELRRLAQGVKPVTTGASSGLFSFEADDDVKAKDVRDKVEEFLGNHQQLKHATFVVDTLPDSGDFSADKEKLIAMNRWRQMQSPSVAVPGISSDSICGIDFVRPALCEIPLAESKKTKVSKSVFERKEYGKEQKKKDFYMKLLEGLPETITFTNDLTELSLDESYGNLNKKIAVIYADGNGFGKLQEELVRQGQEAFDTTVKDYRKDFLATLLGEMLKANAPGWCNKGKLRIETLLWGGDEFMLVVPAWKGWETLQLFYEVSKDWHFKHFDKDNKETIKQLSHSAGMVFCHHKAPIHSIKKLAHDLAELCKKRKDGKENFFAYQVLESFDHIGSELEAYRATFCEEPENLILSGEKMASITKEMSKVKSDEKVARGRLHAIVKAVVNKEHEKANFHMGKFEKGIEEETKSALKELTSVLNGEYSRWLHLADLWDYMSAAKEGDHA